MALPKVYITNLSIDEAYKNELLKINEERKLFEPIYRPDLALDIRASLKDIEIIETMQKIFVSEVNTIIILISNKKMTKTEYLYDWDIASFLSDDDENKRGVIVVLLPETIGPERVYSLESEKILSHSWDEIETPQSKWNQTAFLYPTMPSRLIDNLVKCERDQNTKIEVIKWDHIINNPKNFKAIIQQSLVYAKENEYDSSRPLLPNSLMK